ncbi:MAG: GLPGLI family protein [Bacteroidota bacterium]|jgi:GLPGLI family protein
MKYVLILLLFVTNFVIAQSGQVVYSVQISPNANDKKFEHKDFIAKLIEKATSQQFLLVFNATRSNFKMNEGMNNVSAYDDKIINIAKLAFTSSSDIYYDKENQIEFSKKTDGTILKNTTLNTNWEIQTESKIISSYLCYKAVLKIPFVNRKGEARVNEITAWFAPSLPYSFGPKHFYGLPGLILETTENKTTFLATKITFDSNEVKIDFPKGKTITKEDYDKKLRAQMGM